MLDEKHLNFLFPIGDERKCQKSNRYTQND